ncbi:MAG: putative extracellular nuclease [Acidobacteria bacterium]|nr:putative extracellular nuclease [Acidobacteriota bacterium]
MKLKPYCLNLFNQQSVAAVRLRKLLPTFTDLPRAAIFLTLFISVSLASVNAQKNRAIGEVQGDKNVSPFTGEQVRVSGIVTARLRAGFFIQTPDDKIDANPNTSEGIYVFTKSEPGAEATIGNLVTVTGTVEEYRPKPDPLSLPITEVSMQRGRDSISVESKDNILPKPAFLTVADFKSKAFDALEKYEGMRVAVAEMTVVAPTDGRVDDKTGASESNGVFYGVVKGINRPFREPGFDVYEYSFLSAKDKEKMKTDYPKIPVFDNNPERVRVESSAQLGAQALDVPAYAEIKNLTGVLHYAYRAYSILVDAGSKPAVSNLIKAKALPAPTEQQFSVAGINLENFFDDEDDPGIKEDIVTSEGFEKRLKKISLAIRDYLQSPDVVGIIEAENLATLKKLADRINADAVAAGKPNPKYEAYLIDGNDGRGIDSGFLVKSARVKVLETKMYGKDDKFVNPVSKKEVFLNDRPPLFIKASINDPKTDQPFEFAVIVNHLKSFNGYNDEKDAPFVRMKKKLQAEFLAKVVQERLKVNPNEKIALVGDFNAYQFNDGIVDVIGTIKGKPATKEEVMNASEDLIEKDLINLVDFYKADQRYSYSFDGNAQVLDHILVTESFKKHINNFGYARINADFPEIYRNDANRVERFSDHDAAVVYFTFDDPATQKPR